MKILNVFKCKNKKRSKFKDRVGKKYEGLNLPNYGEAMFEVANYIKNWTKIKPEIIFEIGANFGQDSDVLMEIFKLSPENIYAFEAHPEIFREMQRIQPFKCYNYAVFNENKDITFNIVDTSYRNTGISSISTLPDVETKPVTVEAIRMDKFLNDNNINSIDFLKLDAEGYTYEILEGFGDKINNIKSMHIEAEHAEDGIAHYLFPDIEKFLNNQGFIMVQFNRMANQSDSLWVKKEFLKCKPEDFKS